MDEPSQSPSQELDDAIERQLREAHRHVQPRPEWVEQTLRLMQSELEPRETTLANELPSSWKKPEAAKRSWRGMASIAAAFLAMVSLMVWYPSSKRLERVSQIDSVNVPQEVPTQTSYPPAFDPPNDSSQMAIHAAPGYLAVKRIVEPEFEIYVVLPTSEVR